MARLIEVQYELNKSGFHPASIEADGKIHRFKKDRDDKGKSAWYLCFQNHSDKGEVFYVAVWEDWRDQLGEQFKFISSFTQTRNDRAKIEAQWAEAQRKRLKEQERQWEETSRAAAADWESFSDCADHPYLTEKKIPEAYGCKSIFDPIAEARALIVPVRDVDGKMWGYQKLIKSGPMGKFFLFGTKKTGNYFVLGGSIENEDIVYICEGFATAASVHQALNRPVVVAFDSGNLEPVAKNIRKKWRDKRFVICGDDDQFTESGNAGRDKGEATAKAVLGKAVFPVFKENSERWTDFNDLHLAEGIDAVKNQILGISPEVYRVLTLGHLGEYYYYISSSNQQIVSISRGNHGKTALLDLMPLAFWQSQYPTKLGVDWDSASSDLMEACRRAGVFQPDRVRGVGVWREPKQPTAVVNVGNSVWVDGRMHPLNSFQSRHTYEIGNKITPPSDHPLTVEECKPLIDALEILRWRRPDFAKFMAGWLATAPLAGALQWRSHIWLVGPSGSGKSWFLQHFVNRLLGNNRFFFQGNTTEAGIRQTIGADAKPVIFDEFETDDENTAERIRTMLELIRQASSESDGLIVKGGSGGKAIQYRVRFSAIVGSVRLNLDREQDKNRFSILDLERPGADKSEHLKRLKTSMLPLDEVYGNRLFSRMVRMLPAIQENIETFHTALSNRYNARFGQQYGTLMAGYAALINDHPISFEAAELLVKRLDLTTEAQVVDEKDEVGCINHLMNTKVPVDLGALGRSERSIGELIRLAQTGGDQVVYQNVLGRIGMKIYEHSLCLANDHTELNKLFRWTKWTSGWRKSLERIPGAHTPDKSIRFCGTKMRHLAIPLVTLFDDAAGPTFQVP
jgi:putative DNA primase/helicase